MFEAGERPESTVTEQPAAQITALDINFLPERHRGRRLRFSALRPWLLMACFALLLIPGAQFYRERSAQLTAVEAEFNTVSIALEEYQPLADERSRLEARIAQAESQISAIQDAYDIVDIQLHRWSELVPRLFSAAPPGVSISSISQSYLEITVEGQAEAETLPADYVDRLEQLGEFESVSIQRVERLVLEDPSGPEPTPTATEQAGSEADGQPLESDEPPVVYSFEIRLELTAPEPATPQPTATPDG